MINSMQGHEARETPHSLHDEIERLRRELMLMTKTNRILMDHIEALNLDLGISGDRVWQD